MQASLGNNVTYAADGTHTDPDETAPTGLVDNAMDGASLAAIAGGGVERATGSAERETPKSEPARVPGVVAETLLQTAGINFWHRSSKRNTDRHSNGRCREKLVEPRGRR